MNEEQRKFLIEVVLPKLMELAANDDMPLDMGQLSAYDFEAEAEEYNNREDVVRARLIENLSHYICDDDMGEALDRLYDAADEPHGLDQNADDIVVMWEPLAWRFTVEDLLRQIGA